MREFKRLPLIVWIASVGLTAVVVHTCIRIEVLNARCNNLLPRNISSRGNPKWRVSSEEAVRRQTDRQIAEQRLIQFVDSHPDHTAGGVDQFVGPPYTEGEQQLIDDSLALIRVETELRSWVVGMGLLQFLLGPTVIACAIWLMIRCRSAVGRVASAFCILGSGTAMWFAAYREYFTSLGW